MRARNPLYVMAKPPSEVQAAITALPRNDPGRGPDLLHVTLISLYDLHCAPPEWLPATIVALEATCHPSHDASHPANPISHPHPKKPLS